MKFFNGPKPTTGAGSMTSKTLRCLNAFLCSVGGLAILVLFALLLRMERDSPSTLIAHPDALCVGGEDGGAFVEIAKAEAPNYYVQVRHERKDAWSEGWTEYDTDTKEGFRWVLAVTEFDGAMLFLRTSVAMKPEKAGTPVIMVSGLTVPLQDRLFMRSTTKQVTRVL